MLEKYHKLKRSRIKPSTRTRPWATLFDFTIHVRKLRLVVCPSLSVVSSNSIALITRHGQSNSPHILMSEVGSL